MSALEPEEIRYASISMFGLIMYTTFLAWIGELQTANVYSPTQPNTADVEALNQSSTYNILEPGSFTGPVAYIQAVLDFGVDLITVPVDILVSLLLTWHNLWNIAGFGSGVVIVPMFVMIVIIIGVVFKFVSVLPTT